MTRNIGNEIEAKVHTAKSVIQSPIVSRKSSVAERGSIRKETKKYSVFGGDLHRTYRSAIKSSIRSSVVDSMNHRRLDGCRQSIADDNRSSIDMMTINDNRHAMMTDDDRLVTVDRLADRSRLDRIEAVYADRIDAMLRRLDAEDQRLDKLDAQMQLAIHTIKKAKCVKDLVAELSVCRDELEAAVKEYMRVT